MNSKNTVNISGGSFLSSNIGSGDGIVQNASPAAPTPTIDELLSELRAAQRELVAAVDAGQRQDVADELQKILTSLEGTDPRTAPIRSRWSTVSSIVGPVAAAGTALAETIGKITDMVNAIFGGTAT